MKSPLQKLIYITVCLPCSGLTICLLTLVVADDSKLKVRKLSLFEHVISSDEQPLTKTNLPNESKYITNKKVTTIVPKDAILHIPESLKKFVISEPTGDLHMWAKFYGQNRNLVSHFEVTLKQASGLAPIDPNRITVAKKENKIIVAVMRGNPTSFIPELPF